MVLDIDQFRKESDDPPNDYNIFSLRAIKTYYEDSVFPDPIWTLAQIYGSGR